MKRILEYYNIILNEKSDPRVKTWKLVDTPGPTLYIIGVYLALTLLFLPTFMKNRKPYNLINVIRFYNIFQIAYCCFIIYMMATSGWITGEYSFGCQPVDYTNNPKAVRLLTTFYWVYFIKMIQLTETVFFILRKKFNQVSPLHLYHHTSTLFLAYVGVKFVGGGFSSIPTMMNCFIHILMYTYYYLSSFGPEWQKTLAPWKPRLTTAQLIQFVIMIVHALTNLQPGCNAPKAVILTYIPNIVLLFKMFYDFYTKSYEKRKEKQ